MDNNRVCTERNNAKAEILCRCSHPSVFLCYSCIGPHCKKSPNVLHTQNALTEADLEEKKMNEQDDWKSEMKLINQNHFLKYRSMLMDRKATFVEKRIEMLQNAVEEMKQHIMAED